MEKQIERTLTCTLAIIRTEQGDRIKLSIQDNGSGLTAAFTGANTDDGLDAMGKMAKAEFESWLSLMSDRLDDNEE